ncbi:MAG: 30S ribosomal protein S6, partial [Chloroflexi bacterium]|nr:30S ribosomal protein S6 [Chloroflexota bacterium]
MRHYELVTILSPMLSQDQSNEAWGQISDFITNREGDIFQEQPWGTRRLAYPIHQGAHHFLEGNYRLIRFSAEKPFNQELESFLKFDERVLRSLVISIPDREILPDPVAARPAPAAATAARPAEGGEGRQGGCLRGAAA